MAWAKTWPMPWSCMGPVCVRWGFAAANRGSFSIKASGRAGRFWPRWSARSRNACLGARCWLWASEWLAVSSRATVGCNGCRAIAGTCRRRRLWLRKMCGIYTRLRTRKRMLQNRSPPGCSTRPNPAQQSRDSPCPETRSAWPCPHTTIFLKCATVLASRMRTLSFYGYL